jgi:hypothetical protein
MDEDRLIGEFLEAIEEVLYQDNKFSDKNMADIILQMLVKEYDL